MMISRRTVLTALGLGSAYAMLPSVAFAQARPKINNVVFVHGLFADGSCWTDVITRLQAAGLNATSVQHPLTTLDEAVAETRRVIAQQDGPTVLVGHSYAGSVITGVADRLPERRSGGEHQRSTRVSVRLEDCEHLPLILMTQVEETIPRQQTVEARRGCHTPHVADAGFVTRQVCPKQRNHLRRAVHARQGMSPGRDMAADRNAGTAAEIEDLRGRGQQGQESIDPGGLYEIRRLPRGRP